MRNNEEMNYSLEYDDDEKDIKLASFKSLITSNPVTSPDGAFELNYTWTSTNPVNLNVYVINRPETEGIVPARGSER